MRRILIGLTDRQHERLRREAAAQTSSIAAIVRDAVERTYPDETAARAQARERARAVFGSFHSGASDGSERHDEYLGQLERW